MLSAENELSIPYLAHRLLCVNCSLSDYYCAAIGDNCKAFLIDCDTVESIVQHYEFDVLHKPLWRI